MIFVVDIHGLYHSGRENNPRFIFILLTESKRGFLLTTKVVVGTRRRIGDRLYHPTASAVAPTGWFKIIAPNSFSAQCQRRF